MAKKTWDMGTGLPGGGGKPTGFIDAEGESLPIRVEDYENRTRKFEYV